MSVWEKRVTGLNVSMVLDRRAFLTGAGLAAGAVTVAWKGGYRVLLAPSVTAGLGQAESGTSTEWAADHIFGTYPPYAHPIPYGRPDGASAVVLKSGSYDPFLMV